MTRPYHKKHYTDGRSCWCYPHVILEGNTLIVVHSNGNPPRYIGCATPGCTGEHDFHSSFCHYCRTSNGLIRPGTPSNQKTVQAQVNR